MNVIQRVEHWGDAHHPGWLDVVRIALGMLLFVRGVSFISDTDQLVALMGSSRNINNVWTMMAVHYVAFAHLMGGFLIALGIQTRFAAVIQIPILFVAVFFVNLLRGFSYLNSELWLSILTLILLVVFAVVGSGKLSGYVFMYRSSHQK